MSSWKKYGFLSPKNIPDYKGQTPVIEVYKDGPYYNVVFWHNLMMDDEKIICDSDYCCSLRMAKKKAFKKYREIFNE